MSFVKELTDRTFDAVFSEDIMKPSIKAAPLYFIS
jgi:hypothetical protein